ncbi:MAG: extracellular solute-binding protein, partial [Propionibacteriaceae bacterium]|nr:extracellular solute-binding protein [Propionibacteriaceae bacterium]
MIKKRLLGAAATAALVSLTLAACGGGESNGGGGTAGGSSETVDSLTVLDYYSDEPGHSQIGDMLKKCGTSIGVATVDHQSVPGPTLIQKVLQQASSKTLPDMLMLDNPEIQQIAEAGALMPLGDFGINADGYAPGPEAAATYD